jgi:hypothetical protein
MRGPLDMDGMMMVEQGDKLSFEDMRDDEKMIVQALEQAYRLGVDMMTIGDLQEVAGWDKAAPHACTGDDCDVCDEASYRGNSKVRNNLRRLVKYGVITRPADGTYALVEEPKAVILTPGQPRELNDDENVVVRRIRLYQSLGNEAVDDRSYKIALKLIEPIKRGDCTFYNACIDQAISGKWEGFSCASCSMYSAPDQFQAESDMLALRAMDEAARMIEEHGRVMRVRGVKPGADAKRTASTEVTDE